MCCLAGLTFVTFCHTQKTSDNALVVSFFLGGTNRFKFGDTTETDWVYLQGRGGSGIIKLLLTAFASVFLGGTIINQHLKTSGFNRGCFEIIRVGVSDISDHASDSLQDDTGCFFTGPPPKIYKYGKVNLG